MKDTYLQRRMTVPTRVRQSARRRPHRPKSKVDSNTESIASVSTDVPPQLKSKAQVPLRAGCRRSTPKTKLVRKQAAGATRFDSLVIQYQDAQEDNVLLQEQSPVIIEEVPATAATKEGLL